LVQRYDRAVAGAGLVRRIHQEDVCQALGVAPERKYASEGGPTFRDCFALLRRVAKVPAVEVLKLLDALIFNAIVGNADAHGKNVSLLYAEDGVRLAPLYDLLATVAYPDLTSGFAMKIGGRATLQELDRKGWQAFAAEAGLGLPLIRRRVADLCRCVDDRIPVVLNALRDRALDNAALLALGHAVTTRASLCAQSVR
jgi:serine/threonine-protein kinase HipA